MTSVSLPWLRKMPDGGCGAGGGGRGKHRCCWPPMQITLISRTFAIGQNLVLLLAETYRLSDRKNRNGAFRRGVTTEIENAFASSRKNGLNRSDNHRVSCSGRTDRTAVQVHTRLL